MSKKNSTVILKNRFKDFYDLSSIYQNFEIKLDRLHKKNYLVAVSGGPDSLALVALTKTYSIYKKSNFYYAIVDHGIRKNSNLEAKKVKSILKKQRIHLEILTNKKKISKNIQSEARNIRYKILSNYCKKHKIKTLLTAHNLEDQVETFFIRLSRGSGLKGLSAMKTVRKINKQITLYRPLLDIKKEYLIKISKNIFGEYIRDPSNNNTNYLRTKVRNLKKTLEKSGIKYEQIFRSIQNLSLSKSTLEEYLNKVFNNLIIKGKKEILINYKEYIKLNNETKMALINKSIKQLKKNYYDLRSKKVDNLIKRISEGNFKKTTLGGCVFFRKGENLCLRDEKSIKN